MKALITLSMLVEVDDPAEAEEIRDGIDRSVWHGMADALAAKGARPEDLDGLLTFWPATLALERVKA